MKPITLLQDQVRAALDGRLSQVRIPIDSESESILCPFGIVGDRLWVRESFMVQPTPGCSIGEMYRGSKLSVYYRDETKRDLNNDASFRFKGGHVHACIFDYNSNMYGRWRGPKMMKEWASRITLELTGVRVENDGEKWVWVLDVKRVGQ